MGDEAIQSVWNFDGAELNLIFSIKAETVFYLQGWHLELAYWKLRDLRREIDAKLKTEKGKKEYEIQVEKDGKVKAKKIKLSEKELVDHMLGDLVNERGIFLKSVQKEEEHSRFYLALEEFYLLLCRLMKEHGLYFREGDDPSESFRRR